MFVLHGDNLVESRLFLHELVQQAKQAGLAVINFDGRHTDGQTLLTAGLAQGLLVSQQFVVVENFILAHKQQAKEILKKLETSENTFALWEKTKLSSTLFKGLNNWTVREFKLPPVVFRFLEGLTPENVGASLNSLQHAVSTISSEFLFLMLVRHVRFLIWAKLDPDTLKVPSWQKQKLVAQAKSFTQEQLFDLHKKLLEIDRAQKHSELPENLSASLQLLLTTLDKRTKESVNQRLFSGMIK